MYSKVIDVRFDAETFEGETVPNDLSASPNNIDMGAALLMLGSLTIPNGFSFSSTAMYWGWVRYFAAISTTPDLRVSLPFTDIDPHQKTVLSDDFGVAVTMRWFEGALNGFKQVVDGRKFVLEYASLISQPVIADAKIGPAKCPDFVVHDSRGRWHVIECKGTQTSVSQSISQLERAREQKGVIAIDGALAGHSLAVGLYLTSELYSDRSRIIVHDPPTVQPLVTVHDSAKATQAARSLTASRSFGLAGFSSLAQELVTLSTKDEWLWMLLTAQERRVVAIPLEDREQRLAADLQVERDSFYVDGQAFMGREIETEIRMPNLGYATRKLILRHGVQANYLDALRSLLAEQIVQVVKSESESNRIAGVTIKAGEGDVTIVQDGLFVSNLSVES